ncbi:MAG: hypothetical protein AB7P21_17355 [Lautropia sp.]
MPLLGSAAMLLSFDVAPEAVDEHDRWHTHEHLPERLSIPGFLRGTRWTATAGKPRYMVLYEVRDLQTLASDAYLARLNDPTPWTRRVMSFYRGMSRGLCSVIWSVGHGQGGVAALIRFSSADEDEGALRQWLVERILPSVPAAPGLGSAHLLRGAQTAAMTDEQRIRGADQGVDSALIVTGYHAGLVSGFAATLCADSGLASHKARGVTCATYCASYSLARAEIDA